MRACFSIFMLAMVAIGEEANGTATARLSLYRYL